MLAPCRGSRWNGCGSGAEVRGGGSITLSRTMTEPEPIIRLARPDDAAEIAEVYLRSFHSAMPSITLAHSDDEVRGWIAATVLPDPGLETWVAEAADGSVVGMVVLGPDMLEQLYLLPEAQGRGLGDRFIELARS